MHFLNAPDHYVFLSVEMLLNENVLIQGEKCQLVPYSRDLVEEYHNWFKSDPELLELTGSDILTLEEEFANQESWRTDPDKLTFLIRDTTDRSTGCQSPLCGDINLFLSQEEDDEGCQTERVVGEVNLMIARIESRRKGIAVEALTLFEEYALQHIPNLSVFIAKIQAHNEASINLFQKRGYKSYKDVPCFNEVHLIKDIDAVLSE